MIAMFPGYVDFIDVVIVVVKVVGSGSCGGGGVDGSSDVGSGVGWL